MLILLVVLPALVLGAAAVVVLDRTGVLPRWEAPGGGMSRPGDGTFLERVPRAALAGAMAVMVAWVLAWLVLLVVGLHVLAS